MQRIGSRRIQASPTPAAFFASPATFALPTRGSAVLRFVFATLLLVLSVVVLIHQPRGAPL